MTYRIAAVLALLMGMAGVGRAVPRYPVVITTDRPAYQGKQRLRATLENRSGEAVWVDPLLRISRSSGDGTWTHVFSLRITPRCPVDQDLRPPCVRIGAGERITLPEWDWYTGGRDQCPPRPPGHRAFKGAHRLEVRWCEGKAPPDGAPRLKLITWE